MFTGIVEEIGTVRAIRTGKSGALLEIEASAVGDSIAVNGVCLTVTPGHGSFTADAMPETLRRTSLGSLSVGSKVNLERAMLCGGRFGGHIVSGHVDACGRVVALEKDGIAFGVAYTSHHGLDYPAPSACRLAGQRRSGHAGPVCGAPPAFQCREG